MSAWRPHRATVTILSTRHAVPGVVGTLLLLAASTTAGAQTADDISQTSLNPLKALEKAKLRGFVEQPLFDPARRLPIVAAPVAFAAPPPPPRAPDPPPTLHLLGIIHGKQDVAIVHRDDDPKTVLLYSGDQVGPWTVKILPTNGLRLSNGGRTFDFALFGQSGGKPGVAPGDSVQLGELSTLAQTMAARNARLQRRSY